MTVHARARLLALSVALGLLAFGLHLGRVATSAAQEAGAEAPVTVPHTFRSGTPARASEVNENFQAVADGVNANHAAIEASRAAADESAAALAALEDRLAGAEAALEALPAPENVLRVSPAGGDFTSIAAALASIVDSAEDRPYLVLVRPGVYEETELVDVPSHVHVVGSGRAATVIRATRSSSAQNSDAAVVRMRDASSLRRLSLVNDATTAISIGILVTSASEATRIEDLQVTVTGEGGVGNTAVRLADAAARVTGCTLRASGGRIANSACTAIDLVGEIERPRLDRCELLAPGDAGFGLFALGTEVSVRDCDLRGGQRAVSVSGSGTVDLQGGTATSDDRLFEATGTGRVRCAFARLEGLDPQGLAGAFRYAHCVKADFTPVADGDDSGVE